MASRGIGMLLASCKRLQKAGHKLVLLNPQPLVDASLRTTRIDRMMPIVYELDEALRIVQGLEASLPAASPRREASAGEVPVPTPQMATAASRILPGELKLAIKNEMSELPAVNAALAAFLASHGVPQRAAYAVNLAIDELVVNVMRYAYVDDDVHIIDLQLAIQGEQIILRIVDDGRPFDPRTGPALDLHAEDREVGGLGLLMVLDMVDVLKYQRIEETNCVEVRIRLCGNGRAGRSRGSSGIGGDADLKGRDSLIGEGGFSPRDLGQSLGNFP